MSNSYSVARGPVRDVRYCLICAAYIDDWRVMCPEHSMHARTGMSYWVNNQKMTPTEQRALLIELQRDPSVDGLLRRYLRFGDD